MTKSRFYYFQAVRHQLLNREGSPCVSSEDYNFASCIETKVSNKIGCQPHWTNSNSNSLDSNKLPVCATQVQYTDYINKMAEFSLLDRIQFETKSGCLRPCSYMEYRVYKQ